MVITKYEHACVVVSEGDEQLVIDPGIFSNSLPELGDVAAVVLTHQHPDHVDTAKVTRLLAQNPDMVVYAPEDMKAVYPELQIEAVKPGDSIIAGPFTLEFTGGQHATIHPERPVIQNVGVLVNDTVFYPGDSFVESGVKLQVLLAPAAAPWMKISEAIDYIASTQANLVIPTHDAILSEQGKQIHDGLLSDAAGKTGAEYKRLQPGESLEIS